MGEAAAPVAEPEVVVPELALEVPELAPEVEEREPVLVQGQVVAAVVHRRLHNTGAARPPVRPRLE